MRGRPVVGGPGRLAAPRATGGPGDRERAPHDRAPTTPGARDRRRSADVRVVDNSRRASTCTGGSLTQGRLDRQRRGRLGADGRRRAADEQHARARVTRTTSSSTWLRRRTTTTATGSGGWTKDTPLGGARGALRVAEPGPRRRGVPRGHGRERQRDAVAGSRRRRAANCSGTTRSSCALARWASSIRRRSAAVKRRCSTAARRASGAWKRSLAPPRTVEWRSCGIVWSDPSGARRHPAPVGPLSV